MPDRRPSSFLIEGDCMTRMSLIPDGSVNLILCDLPYGITQNSWDDLLPMERLWTHYHRILAPRGVVALMSHGRFTAHVIISQERLFKYKIVWVKSKATNFLNAKKQPLRKHEDICVFYSRPPFYSPQMAEGDAYDKGVRKDQLTGSYGDFQPSHVRSNGGRYPTDVVYFKTAESEGCVWHSTQKPVELGRYLVRTYTRRGDLVLDHCFGSGSFLVSAVMEGRDAVGIEKNSDIAAFKKGAVDMFEVAVPRLSPWANVAVCLNEETCTADRVERIIQSRNETRRPLLSDEPCGQSDLSLRVAS